MSSINSLQTLLSFVTSTSSKYLPTRRIIQAFLGGLYLVAFLIVVFQYTGLVGENGLYPIELFRQKTNFWASPSLFWADHSDFTLLVAGWIGVGLSGLAITGVTDRYNRGISMASWGLLWLLYLSFVNFGQVFYGYGWETLLLEVGFLAIFLGPRNTPVPVILMWMYRWVAFRVMFGAGLIKLRGDACWWDLSCMLYHYETQPLPGPLSWYFHHLPVWFHKLEVLGNHIIEVLVSFGFFLPGRIGYWAGGITIGFHMWLMLSGNLSWLNLVTILPALACFDEKFWKRFYPFKKPKNKPLSPAYQYLLVGLTLLIGLLSIDPLANLFRSRQLMNASFNSLHLVNTYGAFGSITKVRREIILEGSNDLQHWKPYRFKGKPNDPHRRSPQVTPYHYKIDWQMWFAAMNDARYHPWIFHLVAKLLQNTPQVVDLIEHNPFPQAPPKFIRARLYEYHFTSPQEQASTGAWWRREFLGDYLPPLSLDHPEFQQVLKQMGWGEEL